MPASSSNDSVKRLPDDGTPQLLQWGGSMVGIGLVCVLLLVTVLGGYERRHAQPDAASDAVQKLAGAVVG